jgi:hypothetical protein
MPLEILAATDANLAALSNRLLSSLNNPVDDPKNVCKIAQIVAGSRHPQLCPVMVSLLKRPDALGFYPTLFDNLLRGPAANQSSRDTVIDLVCQKQYPASLAVFGAEGAENLLRDRQIMQCLSRSRNVWVRAGLYLHAPNLCHDQWLKQLLSDLERIREPTAIGELKLYVPDLGADQFLTRRKAAEALQAMGEAAVPGLVQISRDSKLSAEQAAGIDRVIKELRKKPDPFEEYALKHIESEGLYHGKAKEAIRILQALAENDSELYISQQAKKLLVQMEKASKAQPNGGHKVQDPLEFRPKPASDKHPE